jgi:hypothetical protein
MKRSYHLSPQGRVALRRTAAANRPWAKSTGPRTAAGRARSSVNAFKHGERSRAAAEQRRRAAATLRWAAAVVAGRASPGAPSADPAGPK